MAFRRNAGAALLVAATAGAARGEVVAVAADGFVSEHELVIQGAPARVFQALTDEVRAWWDGNHSWSGDAANFSLDARAGGCFCEVLPGGGSVEHMRVVFVQPGKLLRLAGGLGPLQGMGVSGAMDFALSATEEGHTRVRYRYVVNGFVPGGLEPMAEPVDRVQLGQLQRLAAYVATGDPVPESGD